MFKKIGLFLIMIVIGMGKVSAVNEVNLYLFYSETCITCVKEEEFLESIEADYPYLNVIKLETTKSDENNILLSKVRKSLKNNDMTTPYTVIGTMGITGFNDSIEKQITSALKKYHENDFVDIVNVIKNDLDIAYDIDYPETEFSIPLLGDINPKDVSLPVVSMIVGFIDGFNPCAMWVLIFLISMLFNMKNRKRMWILGITFLIASALIYFVFMMSWLQIAITLTKINWVRYIIALIALIGGGINLWGYIKSRKKDDGCEVVSEPRRKKIFTYIKKFTAEKSMFLAIVGILGLAISVNLIELACSSGLPLIFTQILALNDLTNLQYLIYILLYILFFLIDDIVIFVIAMKTLELTGISTKYTKYSHLIGGIIMVLIGLLMALKPGWLMFNWV